MLKHATVNMVIILLISKFLFILYHLGFHSQRSVLSWYLSCSLAEMQWLGETLVLQCMLCQRRKWQPTPVLLPWKIPWTEEPGRLQSMGSLGVNMTERLHFHFSLSCFGEGNSNPLQCSCLENPRDGEPGGLLSMGSHRVGHD